MPTFSYEALGPQGQRIQGVEEAIDQASLVAELAARGIQPIRVRRARPLHALWHWPKVKLSHDDLLYLTKELADLLDAGVPLERALVVVADAADQETVRDLLKNIKEKIRAGQGLSEALAEYPQVFGQLYVNMVRVGELGGVLPAVLRRLDGFLERSRQIRKFILTSSIYPSILLLVGFISIFVLVTFVVPRFGQIFEDLNQPMPLATRMIVEMSFFLQQWWWLLFLGMVATIGGGYVYLRTPEGRRLWDRTILRLPVAGTMLQRVELGRLTRTLGTLLESGVPILKGISLGSEVVGNSVLRRAVEELYKGVRQGKSLSQLMRQARVFPPLMVHLVTIGEETGALGPMLLKIADDMEARVQHDTKLYLSLVEPLTIVVMGLIIGGVIVSMLLAIFGIHDVTF